MEKILKHFMEYLSNFRKVKKVKEPPKTKTVKQRTANVLVYGLFVLFALIGVFGGLRALGVSGQVSNLTNQVSKFEKEVAKKTTGQSDLDISKVRQYMADFLKVYINYSSGSSQERQEQLSSYYSFRVSDGNEVLQTDRLLTGQTMIAIHEEDGFYVADMKLSYTTLEKGQEVSRIRILAVPFKMEKGLLSIISPPYFKQEDVLQGKAQAFERKKSDEVTRVSENVEKSVREFLPVFFDKYALSDEVDLSLVMKEPFLMGGQYVVESINDSSVLVYEEDGYVVTQLSVSFSDKGSNAIHAENFTLYLTKQDSGWFVENMVHYFK